MTRIAVTAKVDDGPTWAQRIKTHADLFRKYGIHGAVEMTYTEDNDISLSFEVEDVDAYFKQMDSAATRTAMAEDGVQRETVKVFVLDDVWTL